MLELLQTFGYRPRFAVWELTLACDMNCKHCGSFAGKPREDELSLEACFKVADQLADLGCERITLGGGEPTLHPGWHQIGRRLSDRGVQVNMISNGFTFDEQQLARAREGGLVSVAFSLDGLEQGHDYMRRRGSFARVMRAVDLCVADKLPVAINTTINAKNAHDLDAIYDLLAEHGVFAWQPQVATPTGNMGHHPDLVLEASDLLWVIPKIAELRNRKGPVRVDPADDIGYFGIFEQDLRDRNSQVPFWIGCRAGCQVIGIESNGNVKGCLSLPSSKHGVDRFVEGNLQEQSLEQIWARKDAFSYNRAFSDDQLQGFCQVCRYRVFCRGGCSWSAVGNTGSRYENTHCFYRQAVEHGRRDLLTEDPTPEEQGFFDARAEKAKTA